MSQGLLFTSDARSLAPWETRQSGWARRKSHGERWRRTLRGIVVDPGFSRAAWFNCSHFEVRATGNCCGTRWYLVPV
jgi:hypothetical protein